MRRLTNVQKFKAYLIVLCILGVAFAGISWGSQLLCDTNVSMLTQSSSWEISDSNLNAELIWQRVEAGDHLRDFTGNPKSGIAASSGNVLYWRPGRNFLCDRNPLVIALDTGTGEEKWHFVPDFLTYQLFSTSDGYILINVMSITLLNEMGHIVWQKGWRDTSLPLRDILTMYEGETNLYFSTVSSVYEVSPQTGEVTDKTEIDRMVGFLEEFALIHEGQSQLKFINLHEDSRELFTIQLSDSRLSQRSLSPIQPYVERRENILLLDFESTTVDAYHLNDGEFLWELRKPLYGIPTVVNDTLIVYGLNGLELYNLRDAEQVGYINLTRTDGWVVDAPSPNKSSPLWITSDKDVIFIRYLDTQELVAIRVNFSNIVLD